MNDLKVDETRRLTEAVGAVKLLARNCAANIMHIGTHLLDAKRLLGATRWKAWAEEHFSWSVADVARMCRVAIAFASVPKPALERIDPTALCVLSERGAPPGARTAAIESATTGSRVTAAAARQLISAARGTVRTAVAVPRGKAEHNTPEDDTAERLAWTALERLTAEGASVRVGRLPDSEEDDPAARPWVCAVYKPDRDPTPVVSKDSLASAVTLAAGVQPPRTCKACDWTGPAFDGFSRKQGNPLGRSFSCRKCETLRVGNAKKIARGTATADELHDRPQRRPPAASAGKADPAGPPAEPRTPPVE